MAPLTVMNWNSRSVLPKQNELDDFLRGYNIDVAVLTETHLEPSAKFSIPRYKIVRQDRTYSQGGGVAILVRDTIKFRQLPDTGTSVIESVGVELECTGDENLKIFAAYCPGQCQYNNGTAWQFQADLDKLTRGKFLVCGDLNARHDLWGNFIRNMNGNLLFRLAQVDDFIVHFPEQPTFISPADNPSTLDIFLANFEINKPLTIETGSSDHHPVICKIELDLAKSMEMNSDGRMSQLFKSLYQVVGAAVGMVRKTSVEDRKTSSKKIPITRQDQESVVLKLWKMIDYAIGPFTNYEADSHGEIADTAAGESEVADFEANLEKPHFEEVEDELKKLRPKRAVSQNGLPSKLFKHGIFALTGGLHMVIIKIWQEEPIAREWIENEVRDRRICKKEDTSSSVCCGYSATVLRNAAYLVLSRILSYRLSPIANAFIGKYRTVTSTEAIFTLRQILEKCREFNVPTHHLFMDMSDTLKTVDRDQLWQIMNEYGLPTKLTRLIKATITSLMTDDNSNYTNGLRPGCELSNLLFKMTIEGIVRRARVVQGGTIFQQNVQLISFDGNMDLITRSIEDLEETYEAFKTEASRVGLIITSGKIKYMRAKGSKEDSLARSSRISLIGDDVEVVGEHLFLGSFVTEDNDTSKEIERRITAGEGVYEQHLRTLQSTRRNNVLKLDIYKKNIRPVVLEGHESWIMLEKDQLKLREFERKVLLTICNTAAQTHSGKNLNRTNKELNELLGDASIVQIVKVDRLWWAGNVIRKSTDSPVRMVLESNPAGTRKRGSQRARWIERVEADARSIGNFQSIWKLAKDSVKWEQLLETANVPGALV